MWARVILKQDFLEDAEKITYEMDEIIDTSHNKKESGGLYINKNKNQEEQNVLE